VKDRTAILTGSVPGYWDRQSALIDALYTPGITAVDNRLVVSYPVKARHGLDEQLKLRIEDSLAGSPDMTWCSIDVLVKNGTVTLEGTVNVHWKKLRAAELAADIQGVVAVTNKLATITDGVGRDEEIARGIIAALEKDPRININAIDVEVGDGGVNLFGTVPDAATRRHAERIAAGVPDTACINNFLIVI
jgi:osmotically-inducible protein OsmY